MNYTLQIHGERLVYPVPNGLPELMSDIAREVLRSQPMNILAFICEYLESLVKTQAASKVALDEVEKVVSCAKVFVTFLDNLGLSRDQADVAASKIQALFRGFRVRERVKSEREMRARGEIPISDAEERLNKILEKNKITRKQAEAAAITIQSLYRGYCVRKERAGYTKLTRFPSHESWRHDWLWKEFHMSPDEIHRLRHPEAPEPVKRTSLIYLPKRSLEIDRVKLMTIFKDKMVDYEEESGGSIVSTEEETSPGIEVVKQESEAIKAESKELSADKKGVGSGDASIIQTTKDLVSKTSMGSSRKIVSKTVSSEIAASVIGPSEAAPSEVAPSEGAPSEGAPSEGVPFEVAPSEGAPSLVAPSVGAPSEVAPSEGAPSEVAPSEAAPSEGAPSEAAPSEGAPSEAVPSEGAPSEAAPSEIAPSEVAPSEGAPSEVAPSEAAPSEGAPSEVAPSEGAPSEVAPSEGAPSEVAPSEGAPSEVAPSEGAPSEVAPSEGVPSEVVPSEGAPPSEVAPSEGAPASEVVASEAVPTEGAPSEVAPSEGEAPPRFGGSPSQVAPSEAGYSTVIAEVTTDEDTSEEPIVKEVDMTEAEITETDADAPSEGEATEPPDTDVEEPAPPEGEQAISEPIESDATETHEHVKEDDSLVPEIQGDIVDELHTEQEAFPEEMTDTDYTTDLPTDTEPED